MVASFVTVTIEPAGNAETFFEDFFGLGEAGKKRRPEACRRHCAWLRSSRATPRSCIWISPPLPVHLALIALLAPLGRR